MSRRTFETETDIRCGIVEIAEMFHVVPAVGTSRSERTGPFDMGENDPRIVNAPCGFLIMHPFTGSNRVGVPVGTGRFPRTVCFHQRAEWRSFADTAQVGI